MSFELKPCPFCGGRAVFMQLPRAGIFDPLRYIGCRGCRAVTSFAAGSDRKAAEMWNRRAERTCRMIDNGCELCCSECDERHGYDDEPAYCKGCGARVAEE